VVAGAGLLLLAAVGVLRMPDVFSRMHSATKASSLGIASVLIGVIGLAPQTTTTLKLLLAVVFQFMTSPVAAHAVARSAYRAGIPLWDGTRFDDMAGDPALRGRA
jgi:multicomponent Na+:H+ antiporter subunit G